MNGLKVVFRNTWLSPRYLSVYYTRVALWEAREWIQGTLLDVGCGLRPYEPLLADCVTRHVGMDRPAKLGLSKADLLGDALYIPIRRQTIDTMLATEVMEHLPDARQFLREAARVLRSGGALILSVPFLEPLHEEPRDYYRFTTHGLRLLLEESGFRIERIWKKGGFGSVVAGSFLSKSLFDMVNPENTAGVRRSDVIAVLVAPFCALLQLVGLFFDKLLDARSYALGYVVVATLGKHA